MKAIDGVISSARTPTGRFALIVPVFCLALFVPEIAGGFLGGSPAGVGTRVLIATAWCAGCILILFTPARRVSWVLPVLLLALGGTKTTLFLRMPVMGWEGRYRTVEPSPERAESFWHWRVHDHKRDVQIAFTGHKGGLFFLNNVRYCCTEYSPSREIALPIEASWNGYVYASAGQRLGFEIRSAETVTLNVIGPEGSTWIAGVDRTGFRVPGNGWRRIEVHYQKSAGKAFEAIVRPTLDNHLTDVWIAPAAPRLWQTRLARLLDFAVLGTFAGALFWAWTPTRRSYPRCRYGDSVVALACASAMIAVVTNGVMRSAALREFSWTIPAGDDRLAYLGFARDILLNNVLMTLGRELGSGAPYYFYPLYSYVLAAAQAWIGEDNGTVALVNGIAVGLTFPMAWLMMLRETRRWVGFLYAGALSMLIVGHLGRFMGDAYTDNLYLPLVYVALLSVHFWLLRGGTLPALTAGIVTAWAAATRPSFLLFPPAILLAVMICRSRGWIVRRRREMVLYIAGLALALAPFTIRNYLVSGRPVILVESWLQIPYFLYTPGEANPIATMGTNPPTLGQSLALAFARLRSSPLEVALLEVRKLAFTIGLSRWQRIGTGTRPEFLAIVLLFVVALRRRQIARPWLPVLAAFCLSHIASMVIAAPWTYPYKSLLPLHAVLLTMTATMWWPAHRPASGESAWGHVPVRSG